eukprot:gene17171-17364_t
MIFMSSISRNGKANFFNNRSMAINKFNAPIARVSYDSAIMESYVIISLAVKIGKGKNMTVMARKLFFCDDRSLMQLGPLLLQALQAEVNWYWHFAEPQQQVLHDRNFAFTPAAIAELVDGLKKGERDQVLLGVTGSGKTFTMAHVIETLQRPALILAPNKILAAQLYGEMRDFFPHNAVEYFVSYYDYYQPEAYVARTDTYIEKTASINEQIDRMRHSATRSLLERKDVIVVASVSCIYGIGGVTTYSEMILPLKTGQIVSQQDVMRRLIELQYKRNDIAFGRGTFRVTIFANSHYVTPGPTMQQAIKQIQADLKIRLQEFEEQGKLLEYQRLEQRTKFDLEMMAATGVCSGAMYKGDRSRKATLYEHGFRLPSCADNRPLKFEEWEGMRPQTVFVSATPGPWELDKTQGSFVEQIIRPTGLIDPVCEIHPCEHQVDDLIHECKLTVAKGFRALVTTLTKKMAEALTDYLNEAGLKVRYLHSDIETLERIEIIRGLRLGDFDVLVGINLLREGLDIPECGLVAILDADKEGYLRSKTSLIQTIGRAARNVEGKVILYADKMTKSMEGALAETNRISGSLQSACNADYVDVGVDAVVLSAKEITKRKSGLEKQMKEAASNLEFEEAARLRDEIRKLDKMELEL